MLPANHANERECRKGLVLFAWICVIRGRNFQVVNACFKKAASSKAYCDEVKGICADAGVEITELSTHLQGQLVATILCGGNALDEHRRWLV